MKRITDLLLPFLCCCILLFLGICAGAVWISPAEVFRDDTFRLIVEMRFFRMLAAFTAGGSLALSGLLFQTVLRNPLAEPFTLGLSGGAAVGAALAFLTGAAAFSTYTISLFAFCGAIVILGLVLIISKGGTQGAESLLLSGVISGTITSGILMYLISDFQNEELAGITWWLLGDLQSVSREILTGNLCLLACSAVAAYAFANDLDALSIGSNEAWDLGVHTKFLTTAVTVVASLLAAATVALCGIVGFCGLVIPHAVKKIFGVRHRRSLPNAVFYGGGFLMCCDILSRLGQYREIPIGVITALIGGPLFLYLLNRKGKKHVH